MENKNYRLFHKRIPLTLLLAAVLLAGASIGTARAYFTATTSADGGYTFAAPDIHERIDGKTKVITISNDERGVLTYVRAKAVTAEKYKNSLTYGLAAGWEQSGEWFYYTTPLEPGAETTALNVTIKAPADEKDDQNFNIIVVYEDTPADEGKTMMECWADSNGGDA